MSDNEEVKHSLGKRARKTNGSLDEEMLRFLMKWYNKNRRMM